MNTSTFQMTGIIHDILEAWPCQMIRVQAALPHVFAQWFWPTSHLQNSEERYQFQGAQLPPKLKGGLANCPKGFLTVAFELQLAPTHNRRECASLALPIIMTSL